MEYENEYNVDVEKHLNISETIGRSLNKMIQPLNTEKIINDII